MVAPLVLALGLLGGNELLRQYKVKSREDELAAGYRGLLGTPAMEMGPPDAQGNMAQQPGTGLLGDPRFANNPEIQLAAGIMGMRGQQAPGINLLNAALQRAQQDAQAQAEAGRWERQFERGGQQFEQGQRNWQAQYDAGRSDANWNKQTWLSDDQLKRQQYQLQDDRWGKEFGLRLRDAARADQGLLLQQQAAQNKGGPDAPKLPVGYQWNQNGVPQPMENTDDWRKGVEGLAALNSARANIAKMRDLVEGKEKVDEKTGKKVKVGGETVRSGGYGAEYGGETAGTMGTLYGAIVSDIAKARGMGVLQPGELENIQDQITNPSKLGAMTTKNSTIAAQYKEFDRQVLARQKVHLAANPWLVPRLPKGFKLEDD